MYALRLKTISSDYIFRFKCTVPGYEIHITIHNFQTSGQYFPFSHE